MRFAHHDRNPGPARAGGFPSGLRVRPGSVRVEFSPGHARFEPGYRLDVVEPDD